jgi:ketosteroid isomerase-like protein
MKDNRFLIPKIIALAISICCYKGSFAQSAEPPVIDVQKAKLIVAGIIKEFEKHYLNGDSVSLAAMYTKNGQLGTATGKDIPAAIGKMIRSSINSNTRHISFSSTSISVDGEFIIEMGVSVGKDDQGNQKWKGKYLVLYKQEDGQWKLYRDIIL